MILLDSNVLSALMRDPPEIAVARWLDTQAARSVWTTAVTIFELRFGIELLEPGKQRMRLTRILENVSQRLEGRIAPLDGEAARRAAELMAARQKRGRPQDLRDTMIAGIALAQHASIATRNTAHFDDAGVTLINPWLV